MKTNPKGKQGKSKNPQRGEKLPKGVNFQDDFALKERQKGGYPKFESRKTLSACGKDNDPQWYFKDQNILNDVASFSYQHPLGAYLEGSQDATDPHMHAIPGLLFATLAIAPGISVDAGSPINLAAQDLYSFVRYKNSGASNYDSPDLMMYIIAMDSMYTCWNWLKRIYGYASTYSSQNRYKPVQYALADNVDLQDIYKNLADFRAYLNMAANRISAFAVPATMTYNIRHSWLFANIYKDSETYKAQEYMYVPAYFYQFQEVSAETGTTLSPVNVLYTRSTTPFTFTMLKGLLDGLINAMSYSEDAGIMSGDILKAYGSDIFKLGTFDADYKVEAVYSREVLTQIENMDVLEVYNTALTQFNIVSDPNTNYIKFQPVVGGGRSYNSPGRNINFHWDNPTPEDMIVATRLNAQFVSSGGNSTLTTCGSEIAIHWAVVCMTYNSITGQLQPDIVQISGTNQGNNLALCLWLWVAFDWAPTLFINGIYEVDGTKGVLTPPLKDYDVYTFVTPGNYEAMNTLALLSEFNVPN